MPAPAVEVPSQGPRNAKVVILGEAPGQQEVESGQPFVGYSGVELSRMLQEAGFNRVECYVTNVCKIRPPGNKIKEFFGTKASKLPTLMGRCCKQPILDGVASLERDLSEINPDLIIALGDTALWACTGESGITKWRGSILACREIPGINPSAPPKVIPTYHPAAILRNWPWRSIAVQDLRRAKRELTERGREIRIPSYRLKIRPTFEESIQTIYQLRDNLDDNPWLAVDIETQKRRIDCIGIAWSSLDAFCIPFITADHGAKAYWSVEEHTKLVVALRELLTDPRAKVIGQNFPYDQQYIAREWGFIPNLVWDTMTIHHSIWATLPKGLDFQSSMYCDFHRYWKEDAKDAGGHRLSDEDQWIYNARDCVVTWEIREKQQLLLDQMKFPIRGGETPQKRQMSFHEPILNAMLNGVQVNMKRRQEVLEEVTTAIQQREEYLNTVCGHPINPRSPKQLQAFFYTDMGMRKIISRKTHNPTTDEEALKKLAKREPLLSPICEFINDIRSLGTYKAVCSVPLDHDLRLRCQYTIPGTDTYRFSSSSDAFGFGTNLQNITAGDEGDADKRDELLARGVLLKPNLRKLLVPDPGYIFGEYDLPQADAQVVAWEADDDSLKEIFRNPDKDLHDENAKTIFGSGCLDSDGKVLPHARQFAKGGVHAANYDVSARTLAAALNISVAQAENFLNVWFKAHPNIKDWQNTVRNSIATKRYVENIFGYRRYVFERPDEAFKECLAWIPQSTVAIITNTGIREVYRNLRTEGVDVLLQVHDSAMYQILADKKVELARKIQEYMTVPAPYDDPLVMVPGGKFSPNSWGDLRKEPTWFE